MEGCLSSCRDAGSTAKSLCGGKACQAQSPGRSQCGGAGLPWRDPPPRPLCHQPGVPSCHASGTSCPRLGGHWHSWSHSVQHGVCMAVRPLHRKGLKWQQPQGWAGSSQLPSGRVQGLSRAMAAHLAIISLRSEQASKVAKLFQNSLL